MLGRRDDAEKLFRRLIGLCNDVGLLAEEYDPRAERQLGNFPQAFSHVALLNTAFNLTRADKPAEQRADLPEGHGQICRGGVCVTSLPVDPDAEGRSAIPKRGGQPSPTL